MTGIYNHNARTAAQRPGTASQRPGTALQRPTTAAHRGGPGKTVMYTSEAAARRAGTVLLYAQSFKHEGNLIAIHCTLGC